MSVIDVASELFERKQSGQKAAMAGTTRELTVSSYVHTVSRK